MSSCIECKYFHFEDWGTCDAFPGGIPLDILAANVAHDEPYEGDNGIQFEPIEKKK